MVAAPIAPGMMTGMGAPPNGFEFEVIGGDVIISHHGRRATKLRGAAANRFIAEVETGDPQEIMARATGDYKRGNERSARDHPRNQGRR